MLSRTANEDTVQIQRNCSVDVLWDAKGLLVAYTPSGILRLRVDADDEARRSIQQLLDSSVCHASQRVLNTPLFRTLVDRGVIHPEEADFSDDVVLNSLTYPRPAKLAQCQALVTDEAGRSGDLNYHLKNAGIQIVPDDTDETNALEICLCRGASEFAMGRNQAARLGGRRILFVMDYRTFIRVGPLVIPPESACLNCLQWRGRAAARNEQSWLDILELTSSALTSPYVGGLQTSIALLEALKVLCDPPASDLENAFIDVSVRDWSSKRHYLMKLPNCPTCNGDI